MILVLDPVLLGGGALSCCRISSWRVLFLPCLGYVHENLGQRLSAVLLAIVG